MFAIRVVTVWASAALGMLLGVGSILAILLEVDGFTGARDADPRVGYVALLGLGLCVSVATPIALWRMLLPEHATAIRQIALASGVVVVVVTATGIGVALTAGSP